MGDGTWDWNGELKGGSRVLNRGDIKADTRKLRANCVFVMSARNFLWRNLRKRRQKVLKLALPPSSAPAVLHGFLRKVEITGVFLLLDKVRRDFQEDAWNPTRIKCFQWGQAEANFYFRGDGWGRGRGARTQLLIKRKEEELNTTGSFTAQKIGWSWRCFCDLKKSPCQLPLISSLYIYNFF